MSFDKAIEHKKEHRKQYEDRRYYETSSRNHKKNSYRKQLADFKNRKKLSKAEYKDE